MSPAAEADRAGVQFANGVVVCIDCAPGLREISDALLDSIEAEAVLASDHNAIALLPCCNECGFPLSESVAVGRSS